MRRRRLFTLSAAISLLLFGCLVVLWITSYSDDVMVCMKDRRTGPSLPEVVRRQVVSEEQASASTSFRHVDATRYWQNIDHEIHFIEGRIGLMRTYDACVPLGAASGVSWQRTQVPRPGFRLTSLAGPQWIGASQALGIGANRFVGQASGPNMPIWPLALVTAILPAIALVHERRRPRSHLCTKCFYDLTGNTSGTCPECGTPIPQTSRPA